MPTPRPSLVLASASPARLGVLRAAGFDPTVVVSGVDEDGVDHLDIAAATVELARRKATAVADRLGPGERVVLGCDTLVEVDGTRHGKPTDLAQARTWWTSMAGGTVEVVTGHWLVAPGGTVGRARAATVRIGSPSAAELDAYLATGEPLAVAGALTIDGYGAPFVDGLDGDHGTVMGLSLPLLRDLLGELGVAVTDLWGAPMTAGPAATLAIGPLAVDPPVVLAPMAGVTDAAYRGLCAGFGAGLYVSEMITARALVEGNAKTAAMIAFAPEERYRSVQLYGVDPATVGAAVALLVGEHGVDHVDLNFGCPVPKVTRKGGGAALPARRVLLGRIIGAAVAAAGPVPVTVKFRIGISDEVVTYLDTGRIAADAGAAAVALHARTAEAAYSGTADWDAIARLTDHVGHDIPVLGNGDIWEAGDAVAMMRSTGCHGVVIGRGCLGRPWLFADLAGAFAGRPPAPAPRLGEVMAVARRHAERLVEVAGEHGGIRRFRKHLSWYLTGYPVGGVVRRRAGQLESLADLDRLVAELDPTLSIAPGAARTVRGHHHGPRPVPLPDGWLDDPDDPTPPAGAELLASGG